MRSIFQKFIKNKNQINKEKYKKFIIPKIVNFREKIQTKEEISFLHYGHLGDIINSLPVIKELSLTKKCNLFIEKDKKIPNHVISNDHPSGGVFLKESSINKLIPLLKQQSYLNRVEIFKDQIIDVDLNFFRELPLNFNIDSVRWYSHLTGCFPNLSNNYLEVNENNKYKNYIVIMRSLRRQNKELDFAFLSAYKNLVFIGLKNEFNDLKNQVKNLEYHDSKDFLELASIIKSSKFFIGNLSFGFAVAEALKVPRLLESGPNFPLVYPNGDRGYDFYFQIHFEELVKKLNSLK
mgnify:CR=1 FL=1